MIIGLALLEINKRRRRGKRRRWQVHPILQRRQLYGAFHTLVRELGEFEDKFSSSINFSVMASAIIVVYKDKTLLKTVRTS